MLPELKKRDLLENRREVPIDDVINMQRRGMTTQEISNNLRQRDFSPDQISEAISHATIKNEVSKNYYQESVESSLPPGTVMSQPNIPLELMNAPSPSSFNSESMQEIREEVPRPMPTQVQSQLQRTFQQLPSSQFAPEPPTRASYEMVEEIVESVVKEKWEDLIKNVGDIRIWKEHMQVDIKAVKQELLRMQERFDSMQKSMMGKLSDYDSGVKEVGTEMKALEQVLQKILGPLTRNIKELEKIVQEMKKKKR